MALVIPDLLPRARVPANWQTGTFENATTGHKIHYAHATAKDAKASVLLMQGLTEPSQKYFETANDLLARGFNVWTFDWQYQGLSGRYAANPQKRHSDGFAADVSDLKKLVLNIMEPEVGNLPKIMLAHSLGANIGLRFLSEYPGHFAAAAFTAPCLGIYKLSLFNKMLARVLRPIQNIVGGYYVRNGDWSENTRKHDGTDIFSSDPARDGVLQAWFTSNPELRVGGVTYGFVLELLKSCEILMDPDMAADIDIPVLMALAGDEKIVDNAPARYFTDNLPQGILLEIDGARHEILMEKDDYRNQFFSAFDKMVEGIHIPPETQDEGTTVQGFTKNKDRLSDRILFALEMALEQEDLPLAEALNKALDLSMTRNAGGGEFVERRDYPREIEIMLKKLRELKS